MCLPNITASRLRRLGAGRVMPKKSTSVADWLPLRIIDRTGSSLNSCLTSITNLEAAG
jgi:hypothetical protein